MIKHRVQHGDDRTHADAGRERQETLFEKDPVTAAKVRQYLYWENLAMGSGESETDDIEFAALTGPDVGPVASGYETGTGDQRAILSGRPQQSRLTGIS